MDLECRLEGENEAAHRGRVLYLEMGADRSLKKVSLQINRSASTVRRWSARDSWPAIAERYDAEIAGARHSAVVAGSKLQALANAGLTTVADEAQLRSIALTSISSRINALLDGLMNLATEAESEQVQLGAIRHALALVGVSPVKRIDQRTELSGSLGVDASVVDIAEADLEAILEDLPMETIRALDDAYQGSAGESASPEASADHQDGEATAGLH